MRSFIIKPSAGISENDLSGNIFALINRIVLDNGYLKIDVEDIVVNDVSSILQTSSALIDNGLLTFTVNPVGDIIVDKALTYVPPAQDLEPPTLRTQPYQGIIPPAPQHLNPPPFTGTRPWDTQETAPTPQEQRDVVEENNEENGEDNDENESNTRLIKSTMVPNNEAENDKKKILLAGAIRNQLSSTSRLVMEKVIELNKIMAKSIVLRNEIDVIMKPLDENPKINNIIEQIETINRSINGLSLIKKVYINTAGDISVLTKRLQTEELKDKTVRDIGEMEIAISSTVILSENITSTTVQNPIVIKNLTHVVYNGDRSFICGHTPEGNICFGNVYEQIHKALLDRNISMVIELIIRFIRNPDITDTWGRYALGFPKVGNS